MAASSRQKPPESTDTAAFSTYGGTVVIENVWFANPGAHGDRVSGMLAGAALLPLAGRGTRQEMMRRRGAALGRGP